MPNSKDTLLRQITMLQLIPCEPRKMATTTLSERLRENGFDVSPRTVQRDLQKLSASFPLASDEDQKPFHWWYTRTVNISLPALDTSNALTFCMAEAHLKHQLPEIAFNCLAQQFQQTKKQLNPLQKNELMRWAGRVRMVPNGKALIPAKIDECVWLHISEALLNGKQIRVTYDCYDKGLSCELPLHPLGLVSHAGASYLIAITKPGDEPSRYALHRILKTQLTDQVVSIPVDFELDNYIASGAFVKAKEPACIRLVAEISPEVVRLLNDTPLSEQQVIAPIVNSDWSRIEAVVPDDQETLGWLYGMNKALKVLEPTCWVEQIRTRLKECLALY